MGILMKEVRAWLYEAEQFIQLASLQEDPQNETKIQEKIEVRIKCYKMNWHYFQLQITTASSFCVKVEWRIQISNS